MVIISIYNVVDISRGFMIQYFEKVDEFTIFSPFTERNPAQFMVENGMGVTSA